jgi:hypothetical protein
MRNDKGENEILKQIEKEYSNLVTLSDHKIEIENEINYLSEYHLKKLTENIENYEKSIDPIILQQGLIPLQYSEYKSEKGMGLMSDDISITNSSKFFEII